MAIIKISLQIVYISIQYEVILLGLWAELLWDQLYRIFFYFKHDTDFKIQKKSNISNGSIFNQSFLFLCYTHLSTFWFKQTNYVQ